MKIKKNWEKIYESDLPPAAEERILRAGRALLEERASEGKGRFWAWLALPALGACAAAVVLIPRTGTERAATVAKNPALRQHLRMVRDAEMLYDLKVLRNLELLKKLEKHKWQKKRS